MAKHICDRCRREEDIPTHQFIKFDNEQHYLCSDCWQRFREWFYRRAGSAGRTPPAVS